jgi:uncharacterized YigZ family protein
VLKQYVTIADFGQKEIVIHKSRFIGYAQPVTSEKEAVAFIERIKKQHGDATHNCSAFVIGERDEIQRSSDDGEPSGTAGKPILEVIRKQGIKDTAIVVTRYFGGIMLGAGGLIRAYTQGAAAAIHAAGYIERTLHQIVSARVDYTWVGKIQRDLEHREDTIQHIDYLDKVTFHIAVRVGEVEAFEQWMNNLTAGQAILRRENTLYLDQALEIEAETDA